MSDYDCCAHKKVMQMLDAIEKDDKYSNEF